MSENQRRKGSRRSVVPLASCKSSTKEAQLPFRRHLSFTAASYEQSVQIHTKLIFGFDNIADLYCVS